MFNKALNIQLTDQDKKEIGCIVGKTIASALEEINMEDGKIIIGSLNINVYSNHAVHDGSSANFDLRMLERV